MTKVSLSFKITRATFPVECSVSVFICFSKCSATDQGALLPRYHFWNSDIFPIVFWAMIISRMQDENKVV